MLGSTPGPLRYQLRASDSRFANKTWQWVVGAMLVWSIVFPIYLWKRSNKPLKPATG